MDRVSNGEFLSGEESGLSSEWFELSWLKAKGYYSIEAFVANKLEVALRLSWLNCYNGKKKGGKLKEKTSMVGVAANVYWRKKGCMDWWESLDKATKEKVFRTVLGKSTKSLTAEILKGTNNAFEDELWLSTRGVEQPLRYNYTVSHRRRFATLGTDAEFIKPSSFSKKPSSLEYILSGLYILQDISIMLVGFQHSEYCKEKLFFSSLGSVSTISDCILRKLRGLLMVVSLDCTKLELLEEGNCKYPTKKSKEKVGASTRRKKGKTRNTKRITPDSKSSKDEVMLDKPAKEHSEGLVNVNAQSATTKNKRRTNKLENSGFNSPLEAGISQGTTKVSSSSVISEGDAAKSNSVYGFSTVENLPNDALSGNEKSIPNSSPFNSTSEPFGKENLAENDDVLGNEDAKCKKNGHLSESNPKSVLFEKGSNNVKPEEKINLIRDPDSASMSNTSTTSSSVHPSHEWPSVPPIHFQSANLHLPTATDRLHLDVGHNWQNHFHQAVVQTVHQGRNSPIENGCNGILSRPLPMSLDWPPMVRISRRQPSFHQGFTTQNVQRNVTTSEDERVYSCDFVDFTDLASSQEVDEHDNNHWEEDYSQYFGGGVMYWNPSDRPGTSFSRPPSLSSDDSLWAWREADMNRAVDDMVTFSSSYSTNGLTSPSTASFCSPFDPLGPPHQALGYVLPGTEVTEKVTMTDIVAEENVSGSLSNLPGDSEVKAGDSLPYTILRPIIIPNMSRERSRSEFKRSHDHKSPCVPSNRRDQPRVKRPPSPVVLCVPHAPCPPPPSPVGDSRKHRGFPTVRSGSSSPRHWGVRGWFHDGINFEESCVRMDGSEVVWPSWRNKSLSAHQLTQPLPGALLQDRLIAMSQLARDQEHPDVAFPLQPPEFMNCSMHKASLSLMHSLLHDEIDSFCKQVAAENMIRKPYINWAVKRVTRSLQVLWPRSRTNIFGSNATGLSLPTSDVDLVVCLPPVRNLEPIKEAGILEGRNGIKETCLQHAARYLANQEWVKNDSLKIVENTAIPIIMLVVEVPCDLVVSAASSNVQVLKDEQVNKVSGEHDINSIQTESVGLECSLLPECSKMKNEGKGVQSVRLDISFKSPSHTGLQTTELVKELTDQFPAATPLALVLKQFLADRSLDQSYSGGLSSYCLILLITRFLQHEHHHGRTINQNFGGLLMDFLYFFGNVFDPRQMRISVHGTGVYANRERGYSIDPICIDDPLFPANNVGRNCFRIHQCIKAFADAYAILENELSCIPNNGNSSACKLLPKIVSSIGLS
ncbi:hypothetical protein LguiB_011003 [Lonicera macranthoides]